MIRLVTAKCLRIFAIFLLALRNARDLQSKYHGYLGSDEPSLVMEQVRDSSRTTRTRYGYERPKPPFQPLGHLSHNCSSTSTNGNFHAKWAVPNLILIGAQKSGTSTIRSVLSKRYGRHVLQPSVKSFEPHFFDVKIRAPSQNFTDMDEAKLCDFRKEYMGYWDQDMMKADVIAFEKTPSYMITPNIIPAIEAICVWRPKILAILRNPIDRAYSHFAMTQRHSRKNKPATFSRVIDQEIVKYIDAGILRGTSLTYSQYERSGSRFTTPFHFYENRTLEEYARLFHEVYAGNRNLDYLYRSFYAPILHPWVTQFGKQDRLLVLQFEDFVAGENLNDTSHLEEILGFAGLDYMQERGAEPHITNTSGRRRLQSLKGEYKPMPARVRFYLLFLYGHFNAMLPDLLGEEWQNVWDEDFFDNSSDASNAEIEKMPKEIVNESLATL